MEDSWRWRLVLRLTSPGWWLLGGFLLACWRRAAASLPAPTLCSWTPGKKKTRKATWLVDTYNQSSRSLSFLPLGVQSQTFRMNKHPESQRILLWFGAVYWWEESKKITYLLLGLKSGFILTPVYQPDCSGDPCKVSLQSGAWGEI